ncbi:MAG: hypothetical protein WA253_02330, partial [Gammaproteobacteria bacterium]
MATNRPLFNHPINPDLERVEQDGALPTLPIEVQQNIAGCLDTQSVGCLSLSFSGFYAFNKDRLIATFLKAVVNDDRETADRMLESRPDLLLMTPPQGMTVKTLAWQTFYAEAAPLMAAKRGQLEMLKIMRPHFDRLPDQEKVNATLAAVKEAWAYQYKKNGQGVVEIMIPEEYTYNANALVDAFIEQPIQSAANLSASAQSAFLAFFDRLLPKGAVHLDDYVNPSVLLLALLNAYFDRFNDFQDRHQRDAFCVRIIGLAQSVLSVEDAKIFCEGLYQVVENGKELSARAKQLKLNDNQTSFYPAGGRPNVDSTTGLGFQFLCGFY